MANRKLLGSIEEGEPLVSDPPPSALAELLRAYEPSFDQIVESRIGSLLRHPEFNGYLSCRESGFGSLYEYLEDFLICHSRLPPRHLRGGFTWSALYCLGFITSVGTTICPCTFDCAGTTKCYRWNNTSDYRAAMASAEGDAGVVAPTPLGVVP